MYDVVLMFFVIFCIPLVVNFFIFMFYYRISRLNLKMIYLLHEENDLGLK